MDFTYHEELDLWVTERKFLRYDIKVRLYCGSDDDLGLLLERATSEVEATWAALRTVIVAELYQQYREQGLAELNADEFFSRLYLKTIDLDAVDLMYTLFFDDGGLFGGHGIQVFWDPEAEFSADVSLVG